MKSKRLVHTGVKRAGIYVRVSSEDQSFQRNPDGKKVDPEEQKKASVRHQEAEALKYCEAKGYLVVKVYRDTEKYRLGNKWVEPTATKNTRPAFKAWLQDAYDNKLDVLVAQAEDRLYRGYDSLADVSRCLDTTGLEIELLEERFDKSLMGIKANIAKLELERKHARQISGIAGRLERGKSWNIFEPFGYRILKLGRDNEATKESEGTWRINPEQAEWVRKMFEWYANGVGIRTIGRQLTAAGVQQRRNKKHEWKHSSVRSILGHNYYWSGTFTTEVERYGKFEISVPVLVDREIGEKVAARLVNQKAAYVHPEHKYSGLADGRIRCASCGVRMTVKHQKQTRNNASDPAQRREYWYDYYTCLSKSDGEHRPGCARTVRVSKIDDELWAKVYPLLTRPDLLEKVVEQRLAEIKGDGNGAADETAKLENHLAKIEAGRQNLIGLVADGTISKEEAAAKIGALNTRRENAQRELNEKQTALGNYFTVEQVRAATKHFRTLAEYDGVTAEGGDFDARRGILRDLGATVEIRNDKSVAVHLAIKLPQSALLPESSKASSRSGRPGSAVRRRAA